MRDLLLVAGIVALFVGLLLTPHDLTIGCNVAWGGVFALVASAPFWWREEGAGLDE